MKNMSKEEKKTGKKMIRIDEDVDSVIAALASGAGITKGEVVKQAIKYMLESERKTDEKFEDDVDRYQRVQSKIGLFGDGPLREFTSGVWQILISERMLDMMDRRKGMDMDDLVKMGLAFHLFPKREGENLELKLKELEEKMREYVDQTMGRVLEQIEGGLGSRISAIEQAISERLSELKERFETSKKKETEEDEKNFMFKMMEELRTNIKDLERKLTEKEIDALRERIKSLEETLTKKPREEEVNYGKVLEELINAVDKLQQLRSKIGGAEKTSIPPPEEAKEKEVMKTIENVTKIVAETIGKPIAEGIKEGVKERMQKSMPFESEPRIESAEELKPKIKEILEETSKKRK